MAFRVFYWIGLLPTIRISSDFYLPIHFFIILVIPIIFEILVHKRSLRDLGIVGYAKKAWLPSLILVVFSILWGILKLVVGYPGGASSIIRLIFLFLTPAVIEEWEFRSFYQTKLERTTNQKTALLIQGIMFGVMHIPNDFFGYFWQMGGRDPLYSVLVMTLQIVLGWIFGIVFLKTRTIWPIIISHYLLDFLNIIILTIMGI